jgi:hypothetical protein
MSLLLTTDLGIIDNPGLALVLWDNAGSSIQKITSRRIMVPLYDQIPDLDSKVDAMLWASIEERRNIPEVRSEEVVEKLQKQITCKLSKLYVFSSSPVLECLRKSKLSLDIIEGLSRPGTGPMIDSHISTYTVLGLPNDCDLGIHVKTCGDQQGVCIFPMSIAAVRLQISE